MPKMRELDSNERLAAHIHGIIRQYYPLLAGVVTVQALDRYVPQLRAHLEERGWLIVPATIPPEITAPDWPACDLCERPAVEAELIEGSSEKIANGKAGVPVYLYYCEWHRRLDHPPKPTS